MRRWGIRCLGGWWGITRGLEVGPMGRMRSVSFPVSFPFPPLSLSLSLTLSGSEEKRAKDSDPTLTLTPLPVSLSLSRRNQNRHEEMPPSRHRTEIDPSKREEHTCETFRCMVLDTLFPSTSLSRSLSLCLSVLCARARKERTNGSGVRTKRVFRRP